MINQEEVQKIVLGVEENLGWEFTEKEVEDVLKYTIRKAELNHKDDSYIPILFENELRDAVMREVINYMGRGNLCARSAT